MSVKDDIDELKRLVAKLEKDKNNKIIGWCVRCGNPIYDTDVKFYRESFGILHMHCV